MKEITLLMGLLFVLSSPAIAGKSVNSERGANAADATFEEKAKEACRDAKDVDACLQEQKAINDQQQKVSSREKTGLKNR